jgi:hypothetical protein
LGLVQRPTIAVMLAAIATQTLAHQLKGDLALPLSKDTLGVVKDTFT